MSMNLIDFNGELFQQGILKKLQEPTDSEIIERLTQKHIGESLTVFELVEEIEKTKLELIEEKKKK